MSQTHEGSPAIVEPDVCPAAETIMMASSGAREEEPHVSLDVEQGYASDDGYSEVEDDEIHRGLEEWQHHSIPTVVSVTDLRGQPRRDYGSVDSQRPRGEALWRRRQHCGCGNSDDDSRGGCLCGAMSLGTLALSGVVLLGLVMYYQ